MGNLSAKSSRNCDLQVECLSLQHLPDYRESPTFFSEPIQIQQKPRDSRPGIDEQFSALMNQKYSEVLAVVAGDESDYTLLADKQDIVVMAKPTKQGFLLLSKFGVQKKAKDFVELFEDKPLLAKVDKNIESITVILRTGSCSVNYTVMRKVFGFTQRDAVICSKCFEGPRTTTIVSTSIEYPGFEPKPDFIRIQVHLGGIHLEDTAGGCRVTYVSESELGTNVPMVVLKKLAAVSMTQFAQALQRALQ